VLLFLIGSVASLLTLPAVAADPATTAKPAAYNTTVIVRATNETELDLAKSQAGARVVFVSSGAHTFGVRSIDDNSQTTFRFSGNDLRPTIILELAANDPLHRVGAVFDAEKDVKLHVYLISALPKDLREFDSAQSVNCNLDQTDLTRAAAEVSPTNARYVVFQWTRTSPTKAPFCVAELSAFSMLSPNSIPPALSVPEVHFAGGSSDFSNKLGTLADPPLLAVVSP
jgi:hypothetical protein